MKTKFNTIGLMGKLHAPDVVETLEAVIANLKKHLFEIILEDKTAKILSENNLPKFTSDEIGKHCDLLIVVGGDGIMLNAARTASLHNIPVLGVNRGRLGFLTDILPEKISKIDEILTGQFYEEERFLLQAEIENKNKFSQDVALNDVVFMSEKVGHMIEFSVYIDDQFVCNYHADGLIVATPTGSTAHALSSGGPILDADLNAFVLVPMLSHNLSSRPVVLKSTSTIRLIYAESNAENACIICDGRTNLILSPGGSVKVSQAKKKLRLLHPKDYNYFETLRFKLNWER